MNSLVCVGLWLCVVLACAFAECGKVFDNKVTADDEKQIVNKHNQLRKLIANGLVPGQPRGVNLKRLKYDHRLAAAAQEIANTCVFAHKTVSDGRWHAVGQNLFLHMSTGKDFKKDWDRSVQEWFDEHKMYSYRSIFSMGTGHYTQVVWANTEYVGCGYTFSGKNSSFWYQKLYVCNYGPAGNYIGELPYKTDQGLNKEQEKYILAKHNKVRKLIANGKVPGQPRGINLKRLKYDASIAKEAQRITDTCVFSHMEVKDNRFPGVGQNLYLERCSEKSSRKNLGRAVQAWFEEHKFYNYSTIRDVPYFKKIGHYTQLVWANTEYLGCGYTSYSDEEMMADYKYITCHYGPGGNILDELPYETGESGCENLC
ncbi:uncharacterized protein LOC132704299 [Cylas formicarius]|uniref:uncharacterized protein LOC132704299 n=1 Tax=Cylas formicarius TaxID=197179 RepID=UPI0029587145|nr:uncharacterized protein LOC132704299 [Cylas formicarius]